MVSTDSRAQSLMPSGSSLEQNSAQSKKPNPRQSRRHSMQLLSSIKRDGSDSHPDPNSAPTHGPSLTRIASRFLLKVWQRPEPAQEIKDDSPPSSPEEPKIPQKHFIPEEPPRIPELPFEGNASHDEDETRFTITPNKETTVNAQLLLDKEPHPEKEANAHLAYSLLDEKPQHGHSPISPKSAHLPGPVVPKRDKRHTLTLKKGKIRKSKSFTPQGLSVSSPDSSFTTESSIEADTSLLEAAMFASVVEPENQVSKNTTPQPLTNTIPQPLTVTEVTNPASSSEPSSFKTASAIENAQEEGPRSADLKTEAHNPSHDENHTLATQPPAESIKETSSLPVSPRLLSHPASPQLVPVNKKLSNTSLRKDWFTRPQRSGTPDSSSDQDTSVPPWAFVSDTAFSSDNNHPPTLPPNESLPSIQFESSFDGGDNDADKSLDTTPGLESKDSESKDGALKLEEDKMEFHDNNDSSSANLENHQDTSGDLEIPKGIPEKALDTNSVPPGSGTQIDTPSEEQGPENVEDGILTSVSKKDAPTLLQNELPTSPNASKVPKVSASHKRDLSEADEYANRLFDGNKLLMSPEHMASWLGTDAPLNNAALTLYMNKYDFTGQRLDEALRQVCSRLDMRAESQQLDRILAKFATRFRACAPNDTYPADVWTETTVHVVSYALLLLNTDLHGQSESKAMSRTQFLRNTMGTLSQEDSFASVAPKAGRMSRAASAAGFSLNTASNPVEEHLKELYSSIQASPIFVIGAKKPSKAKSEPKFHRRPSILNTPPALIPGYTRHTDSEMRRRSFISINSSTAFAHVSSPNVSIFGDVSPSRPVGFALGLDALRMTPEKSHTPSSKVNEADSPAENMALEKTIAANDFGQEMPPGELDDTVLENTLIAQGSQRETSSIQNDTSATKEGSRTLIPSELALMGPPWAKEGLVKRKVLIDRKGQRAGKAERRWTDVFAAVSMCEFKLFTFDSRPEPSSSTVGGGDWINAATCIGQCNLAHVTVREASGSETTQDHCFTIELPDSKYRMAIQAGTKKLVDEWISTITYNAARYSKMPLSGAVGNIEYGWSDISAELEPGNLSSDSVSRTDVSFASENTERRALSIKKLFTPPKRSGSPRIVHEYNAPAPPLTWSELDETSQVRIIEFHLDLVRQEFSAHQDILSVLNRRNTSSVSRVWTNWRRRNEFLTAEIAKYTSYIRSLQDSLRRQQE